MTRVMIEDDGPLNEEEILAEVVIAKAARSKCGPIFRIVATRLDAMYIKRLRRGASRQEAVSEITNLFHFWKGVMAGVTVLMIVVACVTWIYDLAAAGGAIYALVVVFGWTLIIAFIFRRGIKPLGGRIAHLWRRVRRK